MSQSPYTPSGYKISAVPGYAVHKRSVRRRLRRLEGQVRGVQKMVGDNRSRIDVLTQISAVEGGAKVKQLSGAVERLVRG